MITPRVGTNNVQKIIEQKRKTTANNNATNTATNTANKPATIPWTPTNGVAYGGNVANFDSNNADHVRLADLGQEWWKYKNAGDADKMSQAAAKAQAIREGIGNASFDPAKGITTFNTPAPAPMPAPAPAAAPAPKSRTSFVPAKQNYDTKSYIDGLMNARRDQTFAQLDKSRQAALGNIADERAGVAPRYYDQRNQVAAGSQQQARNFAEYMAARGGTNSGAGAQAELMRQGSLQGNLGGLGRQEQQVYDGLDRQTTLTNNAYEQDRLATVSGLEASRMEAMLKQFEADRQFGLQEGSLMGDYQGQQTLQGELGRGGLDLQRAGLTGTLDGQRTIAGQQLDRGIFESDRNFDYGVGRDQVLDNRYSESFDYQQQRDNRKDFESDRLMEYSVYRDNVGDAQFQQQFEQSVKNQAQQMGYNYASLNQRERQMMADQVAMNDDKAYTRMKDQFVMGMDVFKNTGQMPEYMKDFGVDTKAFNNNKTKEAAIITFQAIASGEATPQEILKQAEFEEKQGIIDKETAQAIRDTVYSQNPELSPESVAERKAKQEKRSEILKKAYEFTNMIPTVGLTRKLYQLLGDKVSEYF